MALELQNLCFYVLVALRRHSVFSLEAGVKYYLLGALSSGLLLFGISLIYGLMGTTNFTLLSLLLLNSNMPIFFYSVWVISVIFIVIGLFFKLGLVPFH